MNPRILVLVSALSVPLAAIAAEPARVVAVSGSATVSTEPDRVRFSLGVDSQDPDVTVAFEKTAAAMSAVIQALKASGVDEKEIQTSRMNVSEIRRRDRDRELVTYRATNRVTVTRKELDDVAELLQAAIGAGANGIDSLSFYLADDSKVTGRGLKKAFEDARMKAQQLAALSGAKLGRVLSVTDGTPVYTPQPRAMKTMAFAAESSIAPGMEEVRFQVAVEFELLDRTD